MISDSSGAVRECNLAALSLFGRDTDALVRKPIAAMVAPDDLSEFYAMATAARDGMRKETSLRVLQRGNSAAIATKAGVTRMGTESLFWRFRLNGGVDEVTNVAPPGIAKIETRAMDDALRILVLSQDQDLISPFDMASNSFNGVVEVTPDTRAAVEMFRSFPADVIVADLWSDGHLKQDIIAELRLAAYRPMPIGIAVSGTGGADSAYALKAGFHVFLKKPVSIDSARNALQSISRTLLRRSARRTRLARP